MQNISNLIINEGDLRGIEQKLKTFFIEKKRIEKRYSKISKALKNNRLKCYLPLKNNDINDFKQLETVQSMNNSHHSQNLMNIEQNIEHSSKMNCSLECDISNKIKDFMNYLNDIMIFIEGNNIEGISNLIGYLNYETINDIIQSMNIESFKKINEITLQITERFPNEPYLQYQILNFLYCLFLCCKNANYFNKNYKIILKNIDIFQILINNIQIEDNVQIAHQLLQEIISIGNSSEFIIENKNKIIYYSKILIQNYEDNIDILAEYFQTLISLTNMQNNCQKLVALIQIIENLPLNKILSVNKYLEMYRNIPTQQFKKNKSQNFVFKEIQFYYLLSKQSILASEYIIKNGILFNLIGILFEQFPYDNISSLYCLLEIIKLIKQNIKNNSFQVIDLLLDIKLKYNPNHINTNQQQSFGSDNDNKGSEYSIISLFIRTIQNIQQSYLNNQINSQVQIKVFNKVIKLLLLVIETSEINIHIPQLVQIGLIEQIYLVLIHFEKDKDYRLYDPFKINNNSSQNNNYIQQHEIQTFFDNSLIQKNDNLLQYSNNSDQLNSNLLLNNYYCNQNDQQTQFYNNGQLMCNSVKSNSFDIFILLDSNNKTQKGNKIHDQEEKMNNMKYLFQENTVSCLLDTFKYLFQILSIYKNKIFLSNEKQQLNSNNQMIDENSEYLNNRNDWIYYIYNLLRNSDNVFYYMRQYFYKNQSLLNKIDEIIIMKQQLIVKDSIENNSEEYEEGEEWQDEKMYNNEDDIR